MTLHEPHHAGKPNAGPKRLSLHALVLAAGRGSRFGGGKLQALYRGRPLLAYPLAVIQAAHRRGLIERGHVVVAEDDTASCELVSSMSLEVIRNDAPELGLSHSFQIGFTAMEEAEGPAAAVIFLADQPRVRLEVVEAVISAWHAGGAEVIRPRYQAAPNVPGHPVLVTRSMWPLVQGLKGDAGLGSSISWQVETFVDVPGGNPDVDTPADLRALELLQQ